MPSTPESNLSFKSRNRHEHSDQDPRQGASEIDIEGGVETGADGSYAYVADRGVVLYDEAGKVYRRIGGITDITAQRQAEEANRRHSAALKEAEARSKQQIQALAAAETNKHGSDVAAAKCRPARSSRTR